MSNVEAGGGTVFTQVGTTLFPSKVRTRESDVDSVEL